MLEIGLWSIIVNQLSLGFKIPTSSLGYIQNQNCSPPPKNEFILKLKGVTCQNIFLSFWNYAKANSF